MFATLSASGYRYSLYPNFLSVGADILDHQVKIGLIARVTFEKTNVWTFVTLERVDICPLEYGVLMNLEIGRAS